MYRRRVSLASAVALATILLAACDPPPPPAEVWPGATWATTTPAEAGFDATALQAVVDAANNANSRCIGVYKGGKAVVEQYWRDMTPTTPRMAFSITKSLASTLVGIAESEGLLSTTDLMTQYAPSWVGTQSATITVEDILQMDSGRFVDAADDTFGISFSQDQTAFAESRGQGHPANTVWEYNNSGAQMLEPVIRLSTGMDADAYARAKVFTPLGMTHSSIVKDATGHPRTYTGLTTTCGELARFGLMWLREGRWSSGQIVPSAWVDRASAPSPHKSGYGYMWWLNPNNNFPGAPADTVVGVGFGGNYVFVIPSLDLVITRMIQGGVNNDSFGNQMPGNVLAAQLPATTSTTSTVAPSSTTSTSSVATTSTTSTSSTTTSDSSSSSSL